jgi:N-acetyl-anhydromuramoyl-L-alanine amidase
MTPLNSLSQKPTWTDGWLAAAERIESPNHDPRPDGAVIDLVVIHAISLPPGEFGGPGVGALFQNELDPLAHPYFAEIAHLKVSSHFFIRRDGELVQFVPVGLRAWHAGLSQWQGRARCNDFSVGIELEGDDDTPFETAQYQTLHQVLEALQAVLPITAVTSHAHIAPGRKTDPGPLFDWQNLRAAHPCLEIVP